MRSQTIVGLDRRADQLKAEQLVVEGMTKNAHGAGLIQLHVLCFELWNDERRKPRELTA